ncbi:hypothetical protein Taro_010422, partial [Colocasia esculenta]|nr:hypothetical protein [Colocasia esculenta]
NPATFSQSFLTNLIYWIHLYIAFDQLDSLKDSSSTSSFPAVEVDQKTKSIEDLGVDEIAKRSGM